MAVGRRKADSRAPDVVSRCPLSNDHGGAPGPGYEDHGVSGGECDSLSVCCGAADSDLQGFADDGGGWALSVGERTVSSLRLVQTTWKANEAVGVGAA